ETQQARNQYHIALTYEMKLFLIREKNLSPNHENIAQSLSNIGKCYEHLNQFKTALDYYKRA
ncbi:unnamed protein product, partial [Adineta steineri]